MAKQPFIKIFETKDEALRFKSSPYDQQFVLNGIQLLPNNPYPYVQVSNNPNGVEVEDWSVLAITVCDEVETDITEYFNVDDVIFDDNGQNQIVWSLKNVPFDFGNDFIYLKIDQLGQKYYSSPFKLTNNDSEYTTRFDYRDDEDSPMQSVQLTVFYREDSVAQELESYHEIETGITVTATVKTSYFEKWKSRNMPKSLLVNFVSMFSLNTFVYADLERINLYQPIEIPELTALENWVTIDFMISKIGGANYDPLFVEPEPPIPVEYEVNITGVELLEDIYYINFTDNVPLPKNISIGYYQITGINPPVFTDLITYENPMPIPNEVFESMSPFPPFDINIILVIIHNEQETISNTFNFTP